MIHIDSHVAIWLYGRQEHRLSRAARQAMREPLAISGAALLELEILYEMGRLPVGADAMLAALAARMELRVSDTALAAVAAAGRRFAWTRDPFDRLIVANAMADGARLVTADRVIQTHFDGAVW